MENLLDGDLSKISYIPDKKLHVAVGNELFGTIYNLWSEPFSFPMSPHVHVTVLPPSLSLFLFWMGK